MNMATHSYQACLKVFVSSCKLESWGHPAIMGKRTESTNRMADQSFNKPWITANSHVIVHTSWLSFWTFKNKSYLSDNIY